jgi:hypothetical protein
LKLNNFPFIKHILSIFLKDERMDGCKFAIIPKIAQTLPLSLLEKGALLMNISKDIVFVSN